MAGKTNLFADLSIKIKFIIGIILILVITTFTLSLVFIGQSERLLFEALEDKARLLNKNFSIVSARGILENTFSNLQALINEVAMKDREINALVVAYPNGMVIATSDKEKFRQFSKIRDEDILRQLQKKENTIHRNKKEKVLESIHLIYGQPDPEQEADDFDDEDDACLEHEADLSDTAALAPKDPVGFIYVELRTEYLETSVSDMRTYSVLIALILMGIGIVGAYGFGAAMSEPIESLAQDVRIIASGNLDNSIQSKTRDEVGQLVSDVEKMRLSIKDLTDNLEQKVRERTKQLQEATDQLSEANEEITELNEQLKSENLRLGAELEVTRKLQQMILPTKEELAHITSLEIACYMDPADEVGGDYYDILRHDGTTKIGIGDVTGHGLESGVVMLMTQTAVRTLLNSGETDPVRFLSILNRTIHDNVQRMNVDKSMTLSLLDYVPPGNGSGKKGQVRLSGQHEDAIVVRQDGHVELVDTFELGFPIGMIDDIAEFVSEQSIFLEPGDGLVLYSDGFTEAENMEKELYGQERLCDIISQNWEKSAEEIKDAVVCDVREHIGKQVVYDDLTMVVLKQQ